MAEMAAIREIIEKLRVHHEALFNLPPGTEIQKWFDQDDALYQELLATVPEEGGLVPGKIVEWPVADGYAVYVVEEVGPTVCKMLHVPYGDAWRSPCVDQDGNCLTSIAAEAVRIADLPMFGEK